jgi:hypothetical protein
VTDAIADALLITLANVDAYAGETFDLDNAMGVLEAAAARLQTASADEKRLLTERSRALASEGGDPDRVAFFENLPENLGLNEEE